MSEPKLYEHERLYQARRDAADELYSALSDIMENPLFQTAIGGNPIMVERLIARANAALAKARGEPASADTHPKGGNNGGAVPKADAQRIPTSPPIGTDEELIERLRIRASIRRQIPHRKSNQEGKPDRIADLLDEAADALERLGNLLSAGTVSLTSFDGHCVRIDFSSREEAEQLFAALSQHDGIGPGIAPGTNEG